MLSQEQKQYNKDKRKEERASFNWNSKKYDKASELVKQINDEMFLEMLQKELSEKLERLKSYNF